MTEKKVHKSGFVSIVGKPNAGKSTLLNAMVGRRLAITTPKAQTTRHRILGIANGEDHQIVFSDTPGVILPQYRLHRAMMGMVRSTLEDADLMIWLADVNETFPEEEVIKIMKDAKRRKIPIILVINKVDQSNEEKARLRHAELTARVQPDAAIGISALVGINMLALKDMILEMLPEGPPYFDKESLSDRPERFFVSELIREQIFLQFKQEIPYSTEVAITEFEDKPEIAMIHADIYVNQKSQKGILIGKQGASLKKIGQEARRTIELFLGKKVFLKLYVKVMEGWKDNKMRLRDLGYED